MGLSTVLIISLAAGVILIVGGGLMMYMANLVKSAYEIKVQINTEVEEKLAKMLEDLDKKSRWIKRDLLEEIDKIKVNMQSDSIAKLNDLAGPLLGKIEQIEASVRNEHAEWVKCIDSDRAAIANLDNRLKKLDKLTKKGEPDLAAAPAPAELSLEAGQAAPAATQAAPPAKPPAGQWLPELGNTP